MPTHFMNSCDYKLINFNAPNYLIKNFDNLVRFKRTSRTSKLIHLMEEYCRNEQRNIEQDNSLNQVIHTVEERNRKDLKKSLMKEVNEDREPPMIPTVDDDFTWQDRLSSIGV